MLWRWICVRILFRLHWYNRMEKFKQQNCSIHVQRFENPFLIQWSTEQKREKTKQRTNVKKQWMERMKSASIHVDKISNNHNWKRFYSTFDVSFFTMAWFSVVVVAFSIVVHQVSVFVIFLFLFVLFFYTRSYSTLSLFVQDKMLYLSKAKR